MNNICLIPCHTRPEFLFVTLELIAAAEGADKLEYVFLLDKGYDKNLIPIINNFPFKFGIVERKQTVPGIGKQSMNLLEGYRWAADTKADYVFMIEDDIFIANDFFKWHLAVHEQNPDLFVSIATDNHNSKFEVTTDIESYYIGNHTDYQSLGVCFNRSKIKEHLSPHCNNQYYRNPVQYCSSRYPFTSLHKSFVEQDGLIRRIKEVNKLDAAFPDVPRAYHAGFIGKGRNANKRLRGNMAQRIAKVREIAFDSNKMREAAERPEYFEDSKPVNLKNNQWQKLQKRVAKQL